MQTDIERGEALDFASSSQTFGEYAHDWLGAHPDLRPKTLESCEHLLCQYLDCSALTAFVSFIAAIGLASGCGVLNEADMQPASATAEEPTATEGEPTPATDPTDTVAARPVPASSPDLGTGGIEASSPVTSPVLESVVDRRLPTEGERDRLDDDGRGGVLDCDDDDSGAGTWDWGPIGPDDPTGRDSSDALSDAIAETEGILPDVGWTELTFSEGDSTFVHSIVNDNWRAIVTVGGDPDAGS